MAWIIAHQGYKYAKKKKLDKKAKAKLRKNLKKARAAKRKKHRRKR